MGSVGIGGSRGGTEGPGGTGPAGPAPPLIEPYDQGMLDVGDG